MSQQWCQPYHEAGAYCFVGGRDCYMNTWKLLRFSRVLPLRQNWKVALRPYIMVFLKCKVDDKYATKSFLALFH